MKTWDFRKAASVVVALLGCLWGAGCNRQTEAPPQPPPEVAVVTVQPQQVLLTTELPGRTSAFLVAEIRPQVSGLIEERLDYDRVQALFHANLPKTASLYNDFHAQFVAVGHHYCKKKPRCDECPLAGFG